jgi:hypothetical protein
VAVYPVEYEFFLKRRYPTRKFGSMSFSEALIIVKICKCLCEVFLYFLNYRRRKLYKELIFIVTVKSCILKLVIHICSFRTL